MSNDFGGINIPLVPTLPLPIPGVNVNVQVNVANAVEAALPVFARDGVGLVANAVGAAGEVNIESLMVDAIAVVGADRVMSPLEQRFLVRLSQFLMGGMRPGGPSVADPAGGTGPKVGVDPKPAAVGEPTGSGLPVGASETASSLPAASPNTGVKAAWPTTDKPIEGRTFRSWGDPHEESGDGLKFDNMKVGTFTKLRSASGDFEVQATQGKDATGRWPGATLNHAIAVKSGNDVVAYDGLKKELSINGKQVPVPANGQSIALPGGGWVTGTADGPRITTNKGDIVQIEQKDGYIDFRGEVAAERKDGEIRGSVGAFDNDKDGGNDLLGRTGTQPMNNLDAFLEDWRVKPGESLFNRNDPPGSGGPADPVDRAFAGLDKNGEGYLSGNEIPAELKAAFPGKDRITKEDFKAWVKGAEARNAADFKKADVNGDGWLSGKELTEALKKYDQGGNFKLPNGQVVVELTLAEFQAGKKKELDALLTQWGKDVPPPVGGGDPVGGGGGDDPKPAKAPVGGNVRDVRAFNRMDENRDGFLTGVMARRFKRYDEDGDGQISREEWYKGRSADRAKAQMRRRDVNGDGVLSGNEITKGLQGADANKDGRVTADELLAFRRDREVKARTAYFERRDARAFQARDLNQDGVLSGNELPQGLRADANNDGRVTQAEFRAARAARRGE